MLELLIALLISLNIITADPKAPEAASGKTKTEKPGASKDGSMNTTDDGSGNVVTTWP